MTNKHTDKRRGFTLTELAIVLGVMGTILSAIWVASARVNSSNKAQKAVSEILSTQNAYRSIFFTAKRVDTVPNWGDITAMGINGGAITPDMIAPGNVVQNPWGGLITVLGDSVSNGVIIVSQSLPTSACVSISTSVLSGASNNFGYAIGPNAPPWVFGAAGFGAALTTAQINGLCSGAGNTNQVAFDFFMN
jgi:prepilin-type N-terminal cleavage/methylation domain-containing protein